MSRRESLGLRKEPLVLGRWLSDSGVCHSSNKIRVQIARIQMPGGPGSLPVISGLEVEDSYP